ncbi:hypothetical protein EYZ11_010922 [Aspergillus tanneri]|uniref:Uncharacterized protein n=1 Tax=Aspergillus tanneri TaxID=1220188 RepID=A0A4S3J467_9EURO|nr:uncharacterized protein ATNIH1004_008809 [Aspergillus tanneri]KAA8644603.1 hypothetical protein ATNIH1004_008809 [Aspergillus tanneri]THC89630.1 hypothetical protein EYZ11_010922 [Aspergillus tanneri]
MRRYAVPVTDSESEYSESDISMEIPRQKTSYRRRSISRHRFSPDYSTTYLSPVVPDVRVHRSASTGARRRREPERTQSPAVIVDIKNDSRNKSSNKNRRRQQSQKYQDIYVSPYDSQDETELRNHRRPRASTSSISREASPRHQRDYDMLIDQRLLEKNDARQDLELQRQQQEIERLERELARHRDPHQETRLLKEEEDWYEDEISERLRRLERFEKKQRMDEEQRHAEHRYKLRKFEEAQRREAENEEVQAKLRLERLKELQRKIDEEDERERIKKQIRDEEARQTLEKQEKDRKEAMMKAAAIEEWKRNEERRIAAEREEKKKRDEEFRTRLKMEFGYTEEEIEEILNKKKNPEKEKGKKGKDKEKEKDKDGDKSDHEKKDKEKDEHQRTTWIKVHRKHLLPDTLIAYRLPWDWDDLDSNYIIIKQWITEDFQEELFAHTRRLREGKLVTQTSNTLTELKVNDRKKDKMYLVRKKSPSRRAWIFT